MSAIRTFGFISIFFLCTLYSDANAIETKISDADATNIVLKDITKLDERGSYSRFSPDGKQILFTKKITKKQGNRQLEIPAIWIMDKNGKNMKVLLEDGYNGAWSPDGSKIAYCTPKSFLVGVSKDILSIYDVNAKKKFELISVTNCYNADVAWTKDAKSVYYNDHGFGCSEWLINLDTLKTECADKYYCKTIRSESYPYLDKEVCNKTEWREANLLNVVHPTVYIYDGAGFVGGGLLWIENRDNSFRRLLLKEDVIVKTRSVNISPDLSKILFEISRGGIYIATLDITKNLPSRTFRVGIGRNILRGRWSSSIPEEDVNRYIQEAEERTIYADVYNPQVNPLNNKTIGHGKNKKGLVKLIKISDDYSIIKVVEEISIITAGDVVTYLRAGGSDWSGAFWGVIQTKVDE